MWFAKKRSSLRKKRKSLLKSGKALRGFARGLILEVLGAALIIFLFMMIRIRPIEKQQRMDARENRETPGVRIQDRLAREQSILH